jgi:hypothetical protein
MNEPTLKLAVAVLLPEQIEYDDQFDRYHWLEGNKTVWPEIRETEWLYIVSLVEALLSEDEQRKYASEFMLLRGSSPSSRGTSAFQYMTATFNQRATALVRVLGQKEGV